MTILYPPRTARSSTRNASMVSAASTPSGNKREEWNWLNLGESTSIAAFLPFFPVQNKPSNHQINSSFTKSGPDPFNGRQKQHILAESSKIGHKVAESTNSINGFYRPVECSEHESSSECVRLKEDLSGKFRNGSELRKPINALSAIKCRESHLER